MIIIMILIIIIIFRILNFLVEPFQKTFVLSTGSDFTGVKIGQFYAGQLSLFLYDKHGTQKM